MGRTGTLNFQAAGDRYVEVGQQCRLLVQVSTRLFLPRLTGWLNVPDCASIAIWLGFSARARGVSLRVTQSRVTAHPQTQYVTAPRRHRGVHAPQASSHPNARRDGNEGRTTLSAGIGEPLNCPMEGGCLRSPRMTPIGYLKSEIQTSSFHHRIAQHAEFLDLDLDHVARFEKHGWFAGHADAGRGAGEDDVAGLERANVRQIGDQLAVGNRGQPAS